jgi:hypothetical protein
MVVVSMLLGSVYIWALRRDMVSRAH